MNVLKFTLGGNFAMFKKPDVNAFFYFTYNCIHKVALLGILGAIVGYGGYNQMSFLKKYKKDKNIDYPEFYEKLSRLEVGIVPRNINLNKKVQIFNNSVGYASKEKGGNLIVKEQWLENPSWDIYILLNNDEAKNIASNILSSKSVFIPYLGKNDHIANIYDVEEIKDIKKLELDTVEQIDSLFIKDYVEFSKRSRRNTNIFKYEEVLPYALEKTTNKYEFKYFVHTNSLLSIIDDMICKNTEVNSTTNNSCKVNENIVISDETKGNIDNSVKVNVCEDNNEVNKKRINNSDVNNNFNVMNSMQIYDINDKNIAFF